MPPLPPGRHEPAPALRRRSSLGAIGPFLAAACLACLAGAPACASVEKAAAHDPMRCERDPSCSKGRDNYVDCTKQCVDDPECMDRCRDTQVDRVGHP